MIKDRNDKSVLKKNLKIGIFWEQFEWGGVDSHIKYLINGWEAKEDNFFIIHNSHNEGSKRLKKELNSNNVCFKSFDSYFNSKKNYLNFLIIPIKFLLSVFRYIKIIKNEKLDIIICENGGYPAAYGVLASIFSAFFLKIPVRILIIHHAAVKSRIIMKPFRYFLDYFLPILSSDIFCVSNATKNSLKKYTSLTENNKIIKILYNCVPIFKNQKIKKIFDKEKDEKLIGIIGRIEAYKGHEDLLNAFSKLPIEIKKKNKLMIIGNGKKEIILNLKKLIDKLNISKHVIFTGFIEDKIENIIKSLDLVVMSTRDFEGFGYTIAESMSVGTPVLASKVGAVEEFLNSECGNFFEPKNIDDLYEKLLDFNQKNFEWLKKADNAKVYINKYFYPEKITKEFRKYLLDKLVEDT